MALFLDEKCSKIKKIPTKARAQSIHRAGFSWPTRFLKRIYLFSKFLYGRGCLVI